MSRQIAVPAPLDIALAEPCVRDWLERLDSRTRKSYMSRFRDWLLWLWSLPDWYGKLPSQLLEFQENAKGREKYVLIDLTIQRIQEKGGTYNGMLGRLSVVRSFFNHNRVELPGVGSWRPRPTKEPVQGCLNVSQVTEIITHANLRDTAIFLTLFQSMMDLERFTEFNGKYASALTHHLKEKGLDEPLRIDFPGGRKGNHRKFYTFIHRDALQAWQNYFERARGWPKSGDPIVSSRQHKALSKNAIRGSFTTITAKLALRPKVPKGEKTGVGPHDAFRDVVRSLLQTARKKGFDLTCAEFWMGHSIDPYNYNRFAELEPDYVIENAKIAAEYLNIISGRSLSTSEITGEQLLRVIRDNPTLVQQLAEMVKNQTVQENRGVSEPA